MTFKELLGYNTDDLEAMTDGQLQETLGQYIVFTRPSKVEKLAAVEVKVKVKKALKKVEEKNDMKMELHMMLKQAGINPNDIPKKV